jgi:hypothetical protein
VIGITCAEMTGGTEAEATCTLSCLTFEFVGVTTCERSPSFFDSFDGKSGAGNLAVEAAGAKLML